MHIQNAESILVIIVSALLSLCLIAVIITLIFVMKLVRNVRQIIKKGENLIDTAEEATEMIKNATGKVSFLALLHNIVNAVSHNRKK